jgi:hypothetical protein
MLLRWADTSLSDRKILRKSIKKCDLRLLRLCFLFFLQHPHCLHKQHTQDKQQININKSKLIIEIIAI